MGEKERGRGDRGWEEKGRGEDKEMGRKRGEGGREGGEGRERNICLVFDWALAMPLLVMTSYPFALMIVMKSGFSDAPPTRKPSMSGCFASSLQLSADTEPATTTHKL